MSSALGSARVRKRSEKLRCFSTGGDNLALINLPLFLEMEEEREKCRKAGESHGLSASKYVPKLPSFHDFKENREKCQKKGQFYGQCASSDMLVPHNKDLPPSYLDTLPPEVICKIWRLVTPCRTVSIAFAMKYKTFSSGIVPAPAVPSILHVSHYLRAVGFNIYSPLVINNMPQNVYVDWEQNEFYMNSISCLRAIHRLENTASSVNPDFAQKCRYLYIPQNALRVFAEKIYIPNSHFANLKDLHLVKNPSRGPTPFVAFVPDLIGGRQQQIEFPTLHRNIKKACVCTMLETTKVHVANQARKELVEEQEKLLDDTLVAHRFLAYLESGGNEDEFDWGDSA